MPPIRLLIADDNPEFRETTHLMVSLENDIEVVSLASDGQEAVDLGQQNQPDVAILDVHMPRLDGLTAIRRLAQLSPGTACMAMSYDGERDMLRQAMAAGAREYLIKPFNSDEFVNAIRRVAARGQEPPPIPVTQRDADVEHAREEALINQAVAFLREGRADDQAARVYAELVQIPHLEVGTLTRLAELFLARRDWSTLRLICDRLEHAPKPAADK